MSFGNSSRKSRHPEDERVGIPFLPIAPGKVVVPHRKTMRRCGRSELTPPHARGPARSAASPGWANAPQTARHSTQDLCGGGSTACSPAPVVASANAVMSGLPCSASSSRTHPSRCRGGRWVDRPYGSPASIGKSVETLSACQRSSSARRRASAACRMVMASVPKGSLRGGSARLARVRMA